MTVSKRTESLLARLPDHPLAASMKAAMVDALAAAEQFGGRKIALQSDGRMTPRGQQEALREALLNTFGKQLVRAGASVRKARKEIEAEKAALVIKPVDRTDLAGALERWETREWIKTLDLGVRQSVVLATNDRRILEAVVSAPPELSGFAGDAKFASQIEDRYIELTYPDKLAAIEAKHAVVSEAEAAMHIARNDLRAVLDVDMRPGDFDALMKPLEIDRPWLIDDGRQVCEIVDGKPVYRIANDADRANGIKYENFEAYKRAQGMAA